MRQRAPQDGLQVCCSIPRCRYLRGTKRLPQTGQVRQIPASRLLSNSWQSLRPQVRAQPRFAMNVRPQIGHCFSIIILLALLRSE
jgi:hypothetical protein